MLAAHRDVVITAHGAVSAVAADGPGLWAAVAAGTGGIAPIRRFPTDDFRVHSGALAAGAGDPPHDRARTVELCRRFALDAAREAVRMATLDQGVAPERIALVFGTGLGDFETPAHTIAEELADTLGIQGPRLTVSTACSSSTGAIGLARDLLALGAADAVLAGGADVLSPEVFAGFHALGVLNPAACAPFSHPFGTTLGEGAGFLVLERAPHARARGADILATLDGYGLSGDAFHETSPDPQGAGVERAIRGALGDAALAPEAIEYVNVHGTGTEANDPAEWRGIQRGLGARAQEIPLSSSKGALGHAQGAAGVLEAIVTIEAMRHDVLPPTLNFTTPRPHAPPDTVPGPAPRAGSFRHALSLNAAFGGANAALVLSRPNGTRAARPRRPVSVRGLGLVGPWGLGLEAFATGPRTGAVPDFDIAPLVPQGDPRGLDPVSRFLTAAAVLALREGGVQLRGALRDRAGLVVGQLNASPASQRAFRQSITEHGLPHLSASAFARIVLNAAAGACSKLVALRGPLTAISTGAGSGLAALVLAAELLSTRDEAELMVAGGADEQSEGMGAEGAAMLLLSAGPGAVNIAGWGLAGPGRLDAAIAGALTMAEGGAEDPVRFDAGTAGAAMPAALAAAQAVLALRRGDVRRALVTSAGGRSMSAALLLVRP